MRVISSLPHGRMTSTIDFDRKFGRGAVEVDDEVSDNMLASKLVSSKFSIAETLPKNYLCIGRVSAKVPGVESEEVISHGDPSICTTV